MQWIKCENKLPQEQAWVLVFENGAMNCLMFRPDDGFFAPSGSSALNIYIPEITHWMELPEEPKD